MLVAVVGAMDDSRGQTSEPSAELRAKQEAMREELELRREREKAKGEKYRKLAAKESTRKRAKRRKKESAMLDALVKSTNHGGWRPGSGRKPNYFKKTGIKPITAHELLASLDVPKVIGDLINDRSPQIRLATLNMLLNRVLGLPKETGEFSVAADVPTRFEIVFAPAKPGEPTIALPQQSGSELIEGEVAPKPNVAVEPPPALPQPTASCQYHGNYPIPTFGASVPCPQCKRDSERHERWLAGLMPGGGGVN